MNERINQLAEQAREKKFDYRAREGESHYIYVLNVEKFAELIVEECVGKVTKVSDSIKEFDPDNVDGIDLCDLITYHIKKHFGVEDVKTHQG